jgi:hypothetical protein
MDKVTSAVLRIEIENAEFRGYRKFFPNRSTLLYKTICLYGWKGSYPNKLKDLICNKDTLIIQ